MRSASLRINVFSRRDECGAGAAIVATDNALYTSTKTSVQLLLASRRTEWPRKAATTLRARAAAQTHAGMNHFDIRISYLSAYFTFIFQFWNNLVQSLLVLLDEGRKKRSNLTVEPGAGAVQLFIAQ